MTGVFVCKDDPVTINDLWTFNESSNSGNRWIDPCPYTIFARDVGSYCPVMSFRKGMHL
jgi:hypothetical protein